MSEAAEAAAGAPASKPSGHPQLPLFDYGLVPIPPASGRIRLLTLLPRRVGDGAEPSHFEAPLQCRISTAILTAPPPYQALSYTWGDPKLFNGGLEVQLEADDGAVGGGPALCKIPITESLREILLHLRHESDAATLWIDQVCIDQDSTTEKGQQVAKMGDIYSRASEVLIWLGPTPEQSANALEFINRMKIIVERESMEFIHQMMDRSQSQDQLSASMDKLMATEPLPHPSPDDPVDEFLDRVSDTLFQGATIAKGKELVAEAFVYWCSHKWFSRVWVLQEYALAQKATYVCGQRRMDADLLTIAEFILSLFCVGQRVVNGLGDSEASRTAHLALQAALIDNPLHTLCKLGRRFRFGRASGFTLLRFVQEIFSPQRIQMDSTDARDRIYALLSLCADREDLGIVPDYAEGLTADVLYTRVAHAILRTGGDLSLLELVAFPKQILRNGAPDQEALRRLPSWVPDFFRPRQSFSLPLSEFSRGGRWLYAPTGQDREPRVVTTDDDGGELDETVLALGGIYVDEVDEIAGRSNDAAVANTAKAFVSRTLTKASQVETLCAKSAKKAHDWRARERSVKDPIYETDGRRQEALWRVMIGDIERSSNRLCRRASSATARALGPGVRGIPAMIADKEKRVTGLNADPAAPSSAEEVAMLAVLRLEDLSGMTPFITRETGYVGLGPAHMQPGDVVVLFFGSRTPYVLRPVHTSPERGQARRRSFELVGEAYCDGVMDGELTTRSAEVFNLV